jgi:hypothetical protein
VVEGAARRAALLGKRERFAGRRVGLVLSAGNTDSRLLYPVLLRPLVRSRRPIRLLAGALDARAASPASPRSSPSAATPGAAATSEASGSGPAG